MNKSKILFVASHGGHLRELEYIAEKLQLNIQSHYLIHTNELLINSHNQFFVSNFFWHTPITAFRSSLKILIFLKKNKPKILISTGAAPGAMAICFGWFFGIKTYWFETLTSQKKLSISGRLALYFADQFFVQNEDLSRKLKIPYRGNML